MKCSHPARIFPTGYLTENGKPEYFYSANYGDSFIPVSSLQKKWPERKWLRPLYHFQEVPCGKCFGCMQDKVQQWSFRVAAEAMLYDPSEVWFITLTYDDEHLPQDGQPQKKDLQDFLKALRKVNGKPFRFFACGEKGSLTDRPHLHVLVFGLEEYHFGLVKYDSRQWTSPLLEKIWKRGFCPMSCVSDVGSAGAYVAKYQLKDFGRSGCWLDMSRRPGIGFPLIEKLVEGMDPGNPKPVVVSNGKGGFFYNGVPKALRQRLGFSSASMSKAAYIKQFQKMVRSGYSEEEAVKFCVIEAYRETVEEMNKRKESYRRIYDAHN